MPDFLLGFATEGTLHSIVVVMLALFARDFVVGALRRFSRRIRGDDDPKNDHLADLADAAADSIQKLPKPKR
jgi:hypothetical protein